MVMHPWEGDVPLPKTVRTRGQRSEFGGQHTSHKLRVPATNLWLLLNLCSVAYADDFTTLAQDRTAIEHVYYNHRLGTKPPFEQTMPPTLVAKLVREDLHKETVLKRVYHVEITPAMLIAEVQRITTTTRAPDMLAELKAALDNDTNRFAQAVAKPIVVERILRDKFENDDTLHTPQRHQADSIRTALLAASRDHAGPDQLLTLFKQLGSNQVSETSWQFGKQPDEPEDDSKDLTEVQKQFGQNAQILSKPREAGRGPNSYFEDLTPELQRVLRVQLRQAGDVSAVIETPGGFLLYLCKEKTATRLSVATLSIPKRSYEQWLAEQTD